jgi:hypothetical protein
VPKHRSEDSGWTCRGESAKSVGCRPNRLQNWYIRTARPTSNASAAHRYRLPIRSSTRCACHSLQPPPCADPMLQPHSTHLASQAFQSAAHMPQPQLLVLPRLVSALPAPVDAAATGVLTVCRPTIRCVAPPYLFLSDYQLPQQALLQTFAAAQRMRRNASSKHGVWCCISNMHTAASLGTGEGSRPPGHQSAWTGIITAGTHSEWLAEGLALSCASCAAAPMFHNSLHASALGVMGETLTGRSEPRIPLDVRATRHQLAGARTRVPP